MAVPDFQTLMRPVLESAADQEEHRFSQLVQAMILRFELSDAERQVTIPSGKQLLITNRTGWAKSYLTMAGLLASPRRGVMRITEEGLKVLQDGPERISIAFLRRYPAFAEARGEQGKPADAADEVVPVEGTATPEETLQVNFARLQTALEAELLNRLRTSSPAFFERVVVDVLVAAGYGGSVADAGQAIGQSGDGGIDGIIKEDRLGLDVIYLQAKRWQDTVGRPKIQECVGALQGKRARKGVFLTTSDFSREAREYAASVDCRVILIAGRELARMMVELDVGCSPQETYVIKRIDSDYFEDE